MWALCTVYVFVVPERRSESRKLCSVGILGGWVGWLEMLMLYAPPPSTSFSDEGEGKGSDAGRKHGWYWYSTFARRGRCTRPPPVSDFANHGASPPPFPVRVYVIG